MRDGFVIDPSCSVLRKGFMGGYRYSRVQVSGTERYREEPDKNEYSHPHDALQYLALGVKSTTQVVTGRGVARPVRNTWRGYV